MFTANGAGAGGTLLGIQVAEAVKTVSKFIPGCKALAGELLLAASAQEAVLMPRLVMVGHSSSGDGLEGGGGEIKHEYPHSASLCILEIL